MKKKIAALVVASILVGICVGCSNSSGDTLFGNIDISGAKSSFGIIAEYNAFDIIYDKETGVMYTMSNRSYTYGVLTPLLNSDGTPKIYQK